MAVHASPRAARRRKPARAARPARRTPFRPPRVPPSQAGRKKVFLICHYCGYEPPRVPASGRCPKCGGYSWERFAVPRRLLPAGT